MNRILYSHVYNELRKFFNPQNTSWYQTLLGADFWLDGFDIIYQSNPSCVHNFVKKTNLPKPQRGDFEVFNLALDSWEKERGSVSEVDFLALGLTICEAFGGVPKLWPHDIGVVNDTLAFLTSPSYRNIRIYAYNFGVHFLFVDDSKEYLFRPDLRYFVVPKNFYTHSLNPKRAQFYSISHELVHFWGFGDLYQDLLGTEEYTSFLLLNAEESCCSFDLNVLKELSQYSYTKTIIDEFCEIDTGVGGNSKKNLLENCKKSEDKQRDLEYSLKKKAQSFLSNKNSYCFKDKAAFPESDLWIGDLALKGHAEKTEEFVKYLAHPIRRGYSSLLPQNKRQLEFAKKSFYKSWADEDFFIPNLLFESKVREENIIKNKIRFLIYELAERDIEEGYKKPKGKKLSFANKVSQGLSLEGNEFSRFWLNMEKEFSEVEKKYSGWVGLNPAVI